MPEAPDDVLERTLDAAEELLGRDLVAAVLFGSRARGAAWRDSDYDVLLLVRRELPEETLFQLELCSQGEPPVHFESVSLDAFRAGLAEARVSYLEMLRSRTLLRGELPDDLDQRAARVIAEHGLRPAPWIGKGVWIAERNLPAAPIVAEVERARLEPDRDERIDRMLRALLSLRVRGDLSLTRDRLLALLAEHGLPGEGPDDLAAAFDDPAALDALVMRAIGRRPRD